MNAYDFIYQKNKDHLSDVAIHYLGADYTYGELFERIALFSKALLAAGIEKKDTVTLILPNVPA